jgi:hypothetical protein
MVIVAPGDPSVPVTCCAETGMAQLTKARRAEHKQRTRFIFCNSKAIKAKQSSLLQGLIDAKTD